MSDEDKSLSELLEEYTQAEKCYRLEGSTGVRNLEKIVEALGYDSRFSTSAILNFLEDNPGAQEAIFEWIGEQDLPEWRDAIISELPEEYGDESDGSDSEMDDNPL